MKRKKFLSILGVTGLGTSMGGFASEKYSSLIIGNAPFFKLSLAQWSLHNSIQSGKMSPYDFGNFAKKHQFEGLEYVNTLYNDVMKSKQKSKAVKSFIMKNNKITNDLGLRNVLIMIDDEGNLSTLNKKNRLEAVENHKIWVEAASEMGCHSIRVNLHGTSDAEKWKVTSSESLSKLSDYASDYNINIIVENHGGLSSDADLLMEVMENVNNDNCGTLPDFGNFCISRKWGYGDNGCENEYDKYEGVKKLMPKAFAVSAKSHAFDENGNETEIDYKKMLSIVKEAGYNGYIGVEYEKISLSEEDGIIATKNLLLKAASEI
ncbi:MAG: sugar phosphate isomerase/epimerase family protein [Bacteroidota bacterium]|nr:sugar phosphate isomerase/epimerase family protein [Bacteroidota bacterium]